HIPAGRATFQGDFDFTKSKGFILRVSAGLEVQSGVATWLVQAIDPATGEVVTDPGVGLLLPNDLHGHATHMVTCPIHPTAGLASGPQIKAQARVLFNPPAPQDTNEVADTIDGQAPAPTLTATPLTPGGSAYQVQWSAQDDAGGSGVKHVTVYVAADGGDFKIWQRQTTQTAAVYNGQAGHTYRFLALVTDNAGN